jgi:hypothetical protein
MRSESGGRWSYASVNEKPIKTALSAQLSHTTLCDMKASPKDGAWVLGEDA